VAKIIPLAAPDGQIYTYACGVCFNVAGGSHRFGMKNGPAPELRESYREHADRCCRCHRCKRIGRRFLTLYCKRCAPIEAEEAEARAKVTEQHLAKALDRDAAVALAALMSEISEEYFCAGWLVGLERSLWPMLSGGDRSFGLGEVTEREVAELKRLHEKAGGWWTDGGDVFVTTAEWTALLAAPANGGG
jgi:hypothetical protein